MKPGDIVFQIHNDSILSQIFRWFLSSRWSHSYIITEITARNIYICETSNFEVIINLMNERLDDPGIEFEVWSPIGVSEENRLEAVMSCEENIGEIYGYLQLLSLALKGILKRIGVKIPNFIHAGITCNENAADAIIKYGFFDLIDFKSIDTQDLYLLVKNSGKFELVKSKG